MIEIALNTSTNMKDTAKIYNLWDVPEDRIVRNIAGATEKDVGKFLLFNDGSGWLSPIISVTDYSIRTELCVVRMSDYVSCANIHPTGVAYSGVRKSEEHELVRKYDRLETALVNSNLTGRHKMVRWTPRTKMLTMQKLREEATARGLDQEWFLNRLKTEAEQPRGSIGDRLKALTILARICGVELEKKKEAGGSRGPLFGNVGSLTIQDQRRQEGFANLPASNQMQDIISQVTQVEYDE